MSSTWNVVCDVEKDTVAADEEDDEVDTGQDTERTDPAVSLDAFVHHRVPVFTC